MVSSQKFPREPHHKRPRAEDEYRGIEQLDRAELDEELDEELEAHDEPRAPEADDEDWSRDDTGVRRNPRSSPVPLSTPAPVKAERSA